MLGGKKIVSEAGVVVNREGCPAPQRRSSPKNFLPRISNSARSGFISPEGGTYETTTSRKSCLSTTCVGGRGRRGVRDSISEAWAPNHLFAG